MAFRLCPVLLSGIWTPHYSEPEYQTNYLPDQASVQRGFMLGREKRPQYSFGVYNQ